MGKEKLELLNLNAVGIKEEDYKDFEVLLLPENVFSKKENEGFIDAANSIDFYKFLKENGVKVGNSADLNLSSNLKERRGGDFWFGVMEFIREGITDVYFGLLAAYIYDKIKSQEPLTNHDKKELPKSNVHIKIITKDYNFDYSGDADEFIKIIKSLR